jgi:hypothetical protein
MARDVGLVWSPKNHAAKKEMTFEERLENVLRNMDAVLATANRERSEKEKIAARCQQLESWLLSASISNIDGNFILKEGI